MNKVIAGIVIIIILVAGGWAIHNHKKSPNSSTGNMNGSGTSQNTQSNNSSNQLPVEGKVSIQNMLFTPSQVTIQKGGTVTWTNNDSVAHTVTADNGTSFDSGSINPGQTYSHTFDTSGSYQYHCTIHPSMRGTIVVR